MTDTNTTQPRSSRDLAALFLHATRLMARAYHRRDHAHHAQSRVLAILRERGPIPQSELLEILDVRSSSLSEILGKLERHGLIARSRNEEDKRGFVITATEQAEARPGDRRGEGADALFACLDDTERTQLGDILEKLVAALKDDPLCREPGHGPRGCGHRGHDHGWHRHFHGRGRGGDQED